MSTKTRESSPDVISENGEPGMVHLVYPSNPDVALCGARAPENYVGGWESDETPLDCVVCAEMDWT